MQKNKVLIKRLLLFCAMMLFVSVLLNAECELLYPEHITLYEGESLPSEGNAPYTLTVPASFGSVLESDGSLSGEISQSAAGNYQAELKFWGIIPVRSIEVEVEPQTTLIPGGNAVGIKIFTKGLLCVGTSEIKAENGQIRNLGNDYGIKSGDLFCTANGTELKSSEQFAALIEANGGEALQLEIERGGKKLTKTVRPAKTADGYRFGFWVRDSTAGIGTLTFVGANGEYGALGHPIIDADTGVLMPVSDGTLLCASVLNTQKGKRGVPGELKASFLYDRENLGAIEKNAEQGIFGTLNPSLLRSKFSAIPVASRSQVQEGDASILATVDGENVEEFSVRIRKNTRFVNEKYKDFMIEVTDSRLLEKTGGIVQGMSGSPILQNGKLIGAVTHVFVNDPTRGYGIFINEMLEEMKD